jgi:hypothetical protein
MLRNRAIAGAHCGCSRFAQRVEVLYNEGMSGSNSVVECDLAKVEVAGSNPVSRSKFGEQQPASARFVVFAEVSPSSHWFLFASGCRFRI